MSVTPLVAFARRRHLFPHRGEMVEIFRLPRAHRQIRDKEIEYLQFENLGREVRADTRIRESAYTMPVYAMRMRMRIRTRMRIRMRTRMRMRIRISAFFSRAYTSTECVRVSRLVPVLRIRA
jgi:hypothetical protein